MKDLASLSNTELLSKVSTACELDTACTTLNQIDNVVMPIDSVLIVYSSLFQLRDELVSRISTSDTIFDRANLLQVYYRLCSSLRAYKNYILIFDSEKLENLSDKKLSDDILTSASQIATSSL